MRRNAFPTVFAAAITVAFAAPSVHAVDRAPDSFVWVLSDTGFFAQDSALALSRGGAWPVVFGTIDTVSLFPTESPSPSGAFNFWDRIADGVGSEPRAATSPLGSVAGVSGDPFTPSHNVVISPTGTTTFLPSDLVSVDFNASGTLLSADESGVTGFPYGGPNGIDDIAVSTFGDGGVLAGSTFFSTLTGETFDLFNAAPFIGEGSLTFDAQGRPHAIDENATAFDFDTVSGQWTATSLGTTFTGDTLPIAADGQGTVGAAFVNEDFELIYAYWTHSAGWNTTVVDVNVNEFQVGLAFDFEDLPVISYSKNGNLYVAYDPIVVPEPATLLAAAGLGLIATGRRGRRAA